MAPWRSSFTRIEQRYAQLRRHDAKKEKQLLASMSEVGQQSPVIVVQEATGRYVLVDGYKRARVQQRLRREVLAAVTWELTEPEALLLARLMRTAEGESALEQGWLAAGAARELRADVE